jgi:hypothetical protein
MKYYIKKKVPGFIKIINTMALVFNNFKHYNVQPFVIYLTFTDVTMCHKTTPCGFYYCIVDRNGKLVHERYYVGKDLEKEFMNHIIFELDSIVFYLERLGRSSVVYVNDKQENYCFVCQEKIFTKAEKIYENKIFIGLKHLSCLYKYLPITVLVNGNKNFKLVSDILNKYSSSDDLIYSNDNLQIIFKTICVFKNSTNLLNFDYNTLQKRFPNNVYLKNDHSIPYHMENFPFNLDSWDDLSIKLEDYHDFGFFKPMIEICKQYKIKTVKKYISFYLKYYLKHIVGSFELFRNKLIDYYKIDPIYYTTLEHLSFDLALLTYSNYLYFPSEFNIYFKDNIRLIKPIKPSLNNIESNPKYDSQMRLSPNFNNNQVPSYTLHFDFQGILSFLMTQKLPTGKFKIIERISLNDILTHDDNSNIGYILKIKISKVSKHLSKLIKLPENEFLIHYRLLKVYSPYILIEKVIQVFTFEQTNWMNNYVSQNTILSKTDPYLSNLLINSIFNLYSSSIQTSDKFYCTKFTLLELLMSKLDGFILNCLGELYKKDLDKFKIIYLNETNMIIHFKTDNIYEDFISNENVKKWINADWLNTRESGNLTYLRSINSFDFTN